MAKITIKKSELDRIIKEETLKFKKAISLKKELDTVEKELKQLNECQVDEVVAGAEVESPGKPFMGKQHEPKFHNPVKNPNTMMEDEEEITDVETDVNNTAEDVDSETINKADVLKAIEDLKMALNLHGVEAEEVENVEDTEEVADEANKEEDEEDETFEFEEGAVKEEKMEEVAVKENLDEPIEGESVAQAAEEDGVNPNMEKDTHVNEESDTLMESEKKRMAILAGIMKG